MPLLFPDDLDDDFVEGTFAAEWARLTEEISALAGTVALALTRAANAVLAAFNRRFR